MYRFVWVIIGAIVGMLLARFFWLDQLEDAFVQMMFEHGFPELDFLVQTDTFKKLSIGFVAGGVIGALMFMRFGKSE